VSGSQRETDYRRLVEEVSSHAVFELDADGVVTTWPAPARELYGHDPGGVMGEHFSVLFAETEDLDRPLAAVLDDGREGAVTTDHWHRTADGSVFWGTLTLEPLAEDGEHVGYVGVTQDTTDRKQYERMLERQNDRLKEFTDILAHDLQTPLTVIDGELDLYRESGDEDHLDVVAETTDRMERLVDDLLRVARQGDVVTDPESTDVEAVARRAWTAVVGADDDATLEVESLPRVSADADRLSELFENLFRNAVTHGGDGVTVRVGPLGDGLYVEDDGPGIDEALRDEVFDHGVTTSEDGSGYGLSIVRTVANAHGWDIVATAAADGGARFEMAGLEPLD
jgi:PAS domain S-box-containing protein